MEEQQILDVMKRILEEPDREDRTGVGTKSVFGVEMRFDIEHHFPLMTTRRLALRMIFEELMWILRGQTDTNILNEKKVPVWNPNTSREFLDANGLEHYREGDIGASYGFLMRHFGAEYIDCDTDYTGKGFDQLTHLIEQIQTNPTSRRLMIILWDPSKMHQMALPPCLFGFQFYVKHGKYLCCKLIQRSSDISLAGGWNVAYGALLTYIIAKKTGLIPKELVWSIGDAHIYLNQLEAVRVQVERTPRPYPRLEFKNFPDNILDLSWQDIVLHDYNPYPKIKLEMNA